MKILMVNKYLNPVGGAENYMFKLGSELHNQGYQVQYFGLDNSSNIVGNEYNLYASCYENKKYLKFFPWRMIYSKSAKKLIKKLLLCYQPDIVHMNNINFQLTTSIIDACKELKIPVIMTIHDPQLVCPNHRLFIEQKTEVCKLCLDGQFRHCLENKCFKNSKLQSYIGMKESQFTHKKHKYDYISRFICPSEFIANLLIEGGYDRDKIEVLRNFNAIEPTCGLIEKENYVLYYGRLSEEKGIKTLFESLPEKVQLIVAGKGPLENAIPNKPNIRYVGFKSGEELKMLISKARCTVYPSEWYENSPLSIIESISLGTPVIGTNFGGITELIKNGENGLLFERKNISDLKNKILMMMNDDFYKKLKSNCGPQEEFSLSYYIDKISNIYNQVINEKVS